VKPRIVNHINSARRVKLALCIGVSQYSEYTKFFKDIPSAERDSALMANLLSELNFGCVLRISDESQVTPTKQNIIDACKEIMTMATERHCKLLKSFPDAEPPLIVVHYGGHGVQLAGSKELHFVPSLAGIPRNMEQEDINNIAVWKILFILNPDRFIFD